MLDLCVSRKNKINLDDYDYRTDIQNRMLMSTFSQKDIEVLEEILFGSIRIPLIKLKKDLALNNDELETILKKLEQTQLFTVSSEAIVVDKEMRKYYEFQILKFEDDFKPNMNYIQSLLKKVPIHILPIWYAIPRSSNNIFASMIERYFKTPQLYERYLLDLNLNEPVMAQIIAELFNSEKLQLDAAFVMEKFELTEEVFQEYMLHFEFNFVCCISFVQEKEGYKEVITPFHEWKQYLMFRQNNNPKNIVSSKQVESFSHEDFHFVRDMTYLLEEVIHQPLSLRSSATKQDFIFEDEIVTQLSSGCLNQKSTKDDILSWRLYLSRLASRLVRLGLAIRHEDMLCPHHNAPHWLNMEIEDKALYLYRHPENRTLKMGFDARLDTEKNVKEVEKSLERLQTSDWILIEDFLKGMVCPVGENDVVCLAKEGPEWTYKLPEYQDEELHFMRFVIMQRLFEVGMVNVGSYSNQDCFQLLPFGQETLC